MVYRWFAILKKECNAGVVSYVIMPNHLHVILHFHNDDFNLNTIIANGKRFMAYEIINQLEQTGNVELLYRLESLVTERERKKGQLHKVFKDSFDAKAIITHHFLMQQINYIHNNPVTGKCPSERFCRAEMLVKDFIEYEHSSVSFYEIQLVKNTTGQCII